MPTNLPAVFKVLPGDYLANCYAFLDLGVHESANTAGVSAVQKIMLRWEIYPFVTTPKFTSEETNFPVTVGKEYILTWSNKSELRSDLESWRGKKFDQAEMRRFDLKTVLGARCLLRIGECTVQSSEISGDNLKVFPVKGDAKKDFPKLENRIINFNLSEPDWEIFDSLDETIQSRVKGLPKRRKKKIL